MILLMNLEIYIKFMKQIKILGQLKKLLIFFNKHNFQITIDEKNGEKIIRKNELVKPFMLLYGYTNSATGLTEKDDLIEKLK